MTPFACTDVFVALKVPMLQCGGNFTPASFGLVAGITLSSAEYPAVLHAQVLKDETHATKARDLFNRSGYQIQWNENSHWLSAKSH